MKKILSIVLLFCMLVPSVAFSANEGISLDTYLERFAECPVPIAFSTTEYKNRTLFAAHGGVNTSFFGATFAKSDILEFATGIGEGNMPTVYFWASMYDSEDAQGRIDLATEMIRSLDATKALTKKWTKEKSLLVGKYYPELYMNDAGNINWMWLNTSSKIKDKPTLLSVIPALEYPFFDVIKKYEELAENAEASSPAEALSNGTTLSVGTYDCPAHIPAGEYRVTPQKGGNLFIYRDGSLIVNEILHPDEGDEIGRLVLKEGDSLELAGGAKLGFEPLN